MPTKRVVANLDDLSDFDVERIRPVLKASRAANSVVPTEIATSRHRNRHATVMEPVRNAHRFRPEMMPPYALPTSSAH